MGLVNIVLKYVTTCGWFFKIKLTSYRKQRDCGYPEGVPHRKCLCKNNGKEPENDNNFQLRRWSKLIFLGIIFIECRDKIKIRSTIKK